MLFGLVSLLAAADRDLCVLTPVDAMFQIAPWAAPPINLTKPVAAARGELVHVQVLLTGSDRDVCVTSGPSTLGDVTVRQVGYADLNQTYAGRMTGLYPALLMPLRANNSTHGARGPTAFWLSVRVPLDATAGLHAATLRVSGEQCAAAVSVDFLVSTFAMPQQRNQTTEADFQVGGLAKFSPTGAATPETALNYFRAVANQGVDSFIFHEHVDSMPWAASYRFNEERTGVALNTSMHELWWPRVLALTGPSTRWRLLFSGCILTEPRQNQKGGTSSFGDHIVPNDANWSYVDHEGKTLLVPIFTGTAGEFNPTFERMFRALFGAVDTYLRANSWEEHGSWVGVVDEPEWYDNATLTNTIALMQLYHSISGSIKVFQTRWPDAGSGKGFPASCRPLLDLVDEWCAHAIQWVGPGVPEEMAQAKADRRAAGKELLLTVYDNGVPITEAPNERARFQALDVWRSNGTLDGTLSWYSIDSYTQDPWLNPINTFPGKPAGYGYTLWPPAPDERTSTMWTPRDSIVWVMLGAGLQDAEYLYALQRLKHPSETAKALLAQARDMAQEFPYKWSRHVRDWGDDGYQVDLPGSHDDGSSVVNNWKLAMGAELSRGS